MRYWLDTEFIEDGMFIDLISIGIVAEDGRELYLQDRHFPAHKASDWVRENVFPHLTHTDPPGHALCACAPDDPSCPWKTRRQIAAAIRQFCDPERFGKPEFWGYYCDYDWVLLCQLFGTMMRLPDGWPMYCRDLRQALDERALANVWQPDEMPHIALSDARWIRDTWQQYIAGSGAA